MIVSAIVVFLAHVVSGSRIRYIRRRPKGSLYVSASLPDYGLVYIYIYIPTYICVNK